MFSYFFDTFYADPESGVDGDCIKDCKFLRAVKYFFFFVFLLFSDFIFLRITIATAYEIGVLQHLLHVVRPRSTDKKKKKRKYID